MSARPSGFRDARGRSASLEATGFLNPCAPSNPDVNEAAGSARDNANPLPTVTPNPCRLGRERAHRIFRTTSSRAARWCVGLSLRCGDSRHCNS